MLTVRLPHAEQGSDDTEPLRVVLGSAPADAAIGAVAAALERPGIRKTLTHLGLNTQPPTGLF
jgi:hypothetical protein